jgi:general nucleoside transport system ATP-binding protein
VTKRFGSVVASDDVSLAIHPGEVLALLGENGAGKTTLVNVLAGMVRPDSGGVLMDGTAVSIASPEEALRRGIGTIYQHFTLVPTLSVLENVVLGTETGIRLDLGSRERELGARLGELGLDISPRALVRHLAVGQRQWVEIVKVLQRNPRVLLLDEPTSVLTPPEVGQLFPILRRLAAEGVAIVFITHKLEEALRVSDRIAVLRSGRLVGELAADEVRGDPAAAQRRVVELMFGGAAAAGTRDAERVATGGTGRGPAVLSLCSVAARDERGAMAVHDLSLDLHAGEIVGIAGVDGNGQTELAEVIAGQRRPSAGQVLADGQDITGRGVRAAASAGIGYVTDDRLGEGCVSSGSVALNVVLKRLGRRPFARRWQLDRGAIEREARRLIEQFDVRTPSAATPVGQLSGGNIQKLLLARELVAEPTVLVCNKPTSGLDLKTTRFVLTTLRAQADAGRAVLFISSELDEILELSDRVGVLYRGWLVGLFDRAAADAATIGRLMLGGRLDEPLARGAA